MSWGAYLAASTQPRRAGISYGSIPYSPMLCRCWVLWIPILWSEVTFLILHFCLNVKTSSTDRIGAPQWWRSWPFCLLTWAIGEDLQMLILWFYCCYFHDSILCSSQPVALCRSKGNICSCVCLTWNWVIHTANSEIQRGFKRWLPWTKIWFDFGIHPPPSVAHRGTLAALWLSRANLTLRF